MNLIQVQERLKDLPLPVLANYANGANELEVPSSMALMEINRRNRMRQQAQPAEPPTGTVKDQIEQQAGLAALQQMRMGQAQQQMMQGAAAQPMPVPEGAPQPEQQPQPQFQMAGIANAAAQPGGMRPGVMRMAGGGIVAFAEGGDSEDDEDEDDEDEDTEEAGAGYGGVDTGEGQFPAETPAGEGLRVPPSVRDRFAQRPQAAAPQGPQTITQQRQGLQALMQGRLQAPPTAPEIMSREAMARENPELYGVLNKPIGKEYLAGLEALMAKQGSQDEAARKQLEANKRMDLFKAMIAAGEGTRGRGGLGGLFGGFGRAMIPAMEARAQEAAGIDAAALKREELLNKARYDVEGLQRAQANGDMKAVNAERMKLYDTAVKAYSSGNVALAKELAAVAGIEMRQIAAAAQVEAAKIRAAAKAAGAGAEKLTDQERGVQRYYEAMVAEGAPKGPVTLRNAQEAYLRGRGIASLESTAARRDPAIDAEVRKREMLNTNLYGKSEAEKQAWRVAERDKIVADIEAGRLRLMGAPGSAAPAPRGTKENPIKLPD